MTQSIAPSRDDLADTFVRHCGQAHPTADGLERLYAEGARLGAEDWRTVFTLANAGGMDPLVYHHLGESGLLACLSPGAETLANAYRVSWIHNRRLRGELKALLATLATSGIEVMLVKGVALAQRYYGEIALRPADDIDLLVHPEDADGCARILTRRGYTPFPGRARADQWHSLVNRSLAYHHHAGFTVEVHWCLTGRPEYDASFPLAEIWQRAEHIQVAGPPARYLSAADELRFLSYHYAAQHRGNRLIWLVDIAELVRALPQGWDWDEFSAETIRRRLAMPVATSLRRAERWLGLEVPAEALAALCRAASRPEERRAWQAARASRSELQGIYESMLAQPGTRARLAFIWQGLLWHAVLPALHRLRR